MEPAVGLLEFSSIARGIEAGDAMIKSAPLEVIRAGTVHPGRYLVLVGGLTADVEAAMEAGRRPEATRSSTWSSCPTCTRTLSARWAG